MERREIDIFMWDHPDSLIFVAAGNDGDTGTENGVGTVGTPATHKNGVSVGASLNSIESFKAYNLISLFGQKGEYNDRSLASFSSRGPTKDGRLKPEVCGVGKQPLSSPLFSFHLFFSYPLPSPLSLLLSYPPLPPPLLSSALPSPPLPSQDLTSLVQAPPQALPLPRLLNLVRRQSIEEHHLLHH
jgi:hypothetical protein